MLHCLFWVKFLAAFSRVEDVVEAYFMLRNYLVLRNIPFRKRKMWSDIDVLAFNDKELYIAECKRGAVRDPNTVINHLIAAENFLRSTSPYREIIEKLGLKIKKMYVAEYIRKERAEIEKAGIEVRNVKEVIKDVIDMVQTSLTKEKIEGMYPSPLIRYIVLLCKTKHIRT